MYYKNNEIHLCSLLQGLPGAVAVMSGRAENSEIYGTVKFYQAIGGVLIVADILGLPTSHEACKSPIFAFHIHGGSSCSGNGEDPFANAGSHAGDMPPLFGANGRAFLAFLTDRFTLNEILGKTVIIHDGVDDFSTQPSGNAGKKIACGVISSVRR